MRYLDFTKQKSPSVVVHNYQGLYLSVTWITMLLIRFLN